MTEKTKEYRKNLAEQFVHILEDKPFNWKMEWEGGKDRPRNAKSGACYRGINRLRLMLTAWERGYKDPRWATFNQIRDMGLRLVDAKGQGVQVEYWYPYDRKEKHRISWEEYRLLTEENGNTDIRYILCASYSIVFNAELIEGLPELPEPEIRDISQDRLVETVSRNMGVEILNDGGDRSFYRPGEDKIHLPLPGYFYSDYAYNSTALHELAHATGAPHRLNRNQGGFFGSSEYAYEELVAEITSCFVSAELKTEQDPYHIENHKAYVQSWIKEIREKPEALVKAVAEAEKAAAYLDYKAELIPKEEYEKTVHSSVEEEKEGLDPKPAVKKVPTTRKPRL